ncbi:hypothetical protein RIF29_17920 [Crotalaria pallida]|uniref:Uncharacterized protein n=1 Tax=Crotalaria pallida TaxID=3830 RepID=A0AAN9IFR1_CROPI
MSSLSFLSYMNLSYNNFTGQIPMLCGLPLPRNCTEGKSLEKPKLNGGNKDDSMKDALYLGMGVGFAAGFWGICGSLFLNRAWRHTYFRLLSHVVDKLYVYVMLKLNHIRQIGAN